MIGVSRPRRGDAIQRYKSTSSPLADTESVISLSLPVNHSVETVVYDLSDSLAVL